METLKLESSDKEDPVGCGLCSQKHPHLDSFLGNFFTESIIHGIQYVASTKLNIVERIFWSITILSCSVFAIHQVYDVITKYFDSPVIISLQPKETSVSDIPFPAITICNVNLLKSSVLNRLHENITTELQIHAEEIKNPETMPLSVINTAIALDHLAQFCLAAPSFRRKFNETLRDSTGKLDFINWVQNSLVALNDSFYPIFEKYHGTIQSESADIFSEATMSCEDMILSCIWAGKPIPCGDHFFELDTRNGRCCVFNMMPKYILQNISLNEDRAKVEKDNLPDEAKQGWEKFSKKKVLIDGNTPRDGDRDYPKYQTAGGKPYGLSILVNPILEEYSTCTVNDGSGFKLVAHSAVSSPSIMDYAVGIPLNSEVFVDIEPHATIADQMMLAGIDIEKRGCYLLSDPAAKLQHYNFYSSENCVSECVAEITQRICGCVSHYMPRNASQITCGAKQLMCVDHVRVKIANFTGPKAFCAQCRPACTEINYQLQMSQFDLRKDVSSAHFKYNTSKGAKQTVSNYSIIHLYFGTDSVYAKERKTLYDTNDLIANAGGLLGLALGVSIVSLVELVYFFTLRAWFELKSLWQARQGEGEHDNDKDDRMSYHSGGNDGGGPPQLDKCSNDEGDHFGKNLRHAETLQSVAADANYKSNFRGNLS